MLAGLVGRAAGVSPIVRDGPLRPLAVESLPRCPTRPRGPLLNLLVAFCRSIWTFRTALHITDPSGRQLFC